MTTAATATMAVGTAAAMAEGGPEAALAPPARARRRHAAGTARILTAGVSASAGLGIVTALALTSRAPEPAPAPTSGPAAGASTGAAAVVATVGTDPTTGATTAPTASPAPSPPTSVVRRYIVVPVPAGAADLSATDPAATSATPPAPTPPAARQPRPATPVNPPAAAPAPGPAAVTRGSG
jgi:hypothetical protein